MAETILENYNKQSVTSDNVVSTRMKHSTFDSMVRYAKFLGYGDFHTKIDHKTGLIAIVAIHNLNRGPAIGGCRMVHYKAMEYA
jgi:glutamate dehydrogenase/leucine dehydrogenase